MMRPALLVSALFVMGIACRLSAAEPETAPARRKTPTSGPASVTTWVNPRTEVPKRPGLKYKRLHHRTIHSEAMKRDVGARALRSVVEELMLDLLYDLPEAADQGACYEITAEMVAGETKPSLFAAKKKKTA